MLAPSALPGLAVLIAQAARLARPAAVLAATRPARRTALFAGKTPISRGLR